MSFDGYSIDRAYDDDLTVTITLREYRELLTVLAKTEGYLLASIASNSDLKETTLESALNESLKERVMALAKINGYEIDTKEKENA